MKKLFLAGAMALAMTAFAAPAMADDTSGLQTLVNDATPGSTITLTQNYTLTDTVDITKNITINGAGYTVTGAANSHVFNITADANDATLNDIVITASGTGYGVYTSGKNLEVTDCVINTANRGITFWPTNGQGATLQVSDTEIYNTDIENYDSNADIGDSRGISFSNVTAGDIDIDTCEIYGFGYSLNVINDPDTNGLRDSEGTTYDITNSIIKGWTALNLWAADADITFTGSTLVGINTSDGSWDSFATIRANDGIYGGSDDQETTINLKGGSVIAKQYGTAAETPFTVDNELQTKFTFAPYNRQVVSIEVYVPGTTASIFTFPFGVSVDDMNAYMNSDKLVGFFNEATGEFDSQNVNIIAAPISAANTVSTMANVSLIDDRMPVLQADFAVGGNNA